MAFGLMLSGAGAWALKCDVDNNGRIDRLDIGLIQQAIVQKSPVSGPDDPRDLDNNNVINATDSRTCTLRCKYASCAVNGAPVANAGTSATTRVGQAITLSGAASSDPDGDALIYAWVFTSRPAGSAASLSSASTVAPSFTADRAGSYVVQLVVNDGAASSAAASVSVSTINTAPVANAGANVNANVGQTVALSGAASTDPDGDALTYAWSFTSRPAGSTASLSGSASVTPSFTADSPGTYVVQLVTNDGTMDSMAASVSVSVIAVHSAPVADAGLPQSARVGETVTLDGRQSSDPDGSVLSYAWRIKEAPSGSTAVLGNPTAAQPTLILDKSGSYEIELVVSDGSLASPPAFVVVTTLNSAPVARQVGDRTVSFGAIVSLDGSGSSDADGNALTYAWTLSTRPAGSVASLSNPSLVNPSFTPDRIGSYVVQLVVNDGSVNSAAAAATITVIAGTPAAITNILPAEGSKLPADERPEISASFVDNGGGIDTASVIVELDGQKVTAAATVSAIGVSFTPAQPLSEGAHTLRIRVSDLGGTQVTSTVGFKTLSLPVISGESPIDVFLPGGATPVISATLSDVGAGIDPASVRLVFNGVDVTAAAQISATGVSYQVPTALTDATHTVKVSVSDRAGNAAQTTWQFGTATAPEILTTSPRDTLFAAGSQPTIVASYRDTRAGIDPSGVHLYVNGVDVVSSATVTGTQISYTPATPMPAGPVTVYLEVANRANALAGATWGFEVDTPSNYSLALVSPAVPMTTTTPKLQVVATASATRSSVRAVTVNGFATRPTSQGDGAMQFVADIDLADGENTISVLAAFEDGQIRTAETTVTFDAPPRVTITAPVDKLTLGPANGTSPRDLTGNVDRPVTITGRVSKPVISVTINQQQAQVNGQDFRFDNFFLHEGVNHVKVAAADASGRVGTAAITVSVDQTAPILTVEQPFSGVVTSNNKIDVRGIANDAVEGMSGAPEPTVAVHNAANNASIRAEVADRYYLASGIPLAVGENALTITATDQAGNKRTLDLKVIRVAVGSERLAAASGNFQQGSMHSELPQALVVTALSKSGEALAGVPVSFDVVRGTGWISTIQGQIQKIDGINPTRNLLVTTDAQGQAQVWFTPGKQSGAGAHAVRAWVNTAAMAPGVAGATITEDLHFYATTSRGLPTQVLGDMGLNQFAEVRSQPLELLSAVVRDEFNNLLPNVPVTFRISEGDAYFLLANGDRSADNGRSVTVMSDKNGFAAVRPTLGETPGIVRILATVKSDPANPSSSEVGGAGYVIQALLPQDGPAVFVGRIFTDKNKALPGVRVSIARTSLSSTTDDQGYFRLENVPPGRVDLFIDGRTSSFENQIWPSLHFESTAVRGRENSLAHPIYLPPLAMAGAKTVGGNEDVILKIAGLEGFQMKVKANSVTFPDGSKVGTLVVSPVVADRLPMAPPAGAANFGIPAWTIQPAGTRFDPPIEVTMPNTRAMRPGETVPVVQWDHDLAQFVPMGHATVSEDGAVMVTDAGSGVTKAGWGGACVYDPNNCGKNGPPKCTDCEKLTTAKCPTCEADPSKDGRRIANFAGQIGLELQNELYRKVKFITDKLGVIVEVKGGANISYSGEEICCAAKEGAMKVEVGGAAQVEGAAIIPLLPVLKKFAGFLFNDAIQGPGLVFKANLAGGGSLSYDRCKESGDGNLKFPGALEAALSVGGGNFHFTQSQLGGDVVNRTGDLRPLDAGISGTADITISKVVSNGVVVAGSAFVSLFAKSSISVGTFNWTILDLSYPVWQGSFPDTLLRIPGL